MNGLLDTQTRTVDGPTPEQISAAVELALDEDLSLGADVTTLACVAIDARGTAAVVSRQPGLLAGLELAVQALRTVAARSGTELIIEQLAADRDRLRPGQPVLQVSGSLRTVLTAERTALNLLGQLSGVASLTARWVEAIDGTAAIIRDTRKTVPGLRALQKYAVRCGGGQNHRMALGDAALIKDNHIAAAGSVAAAFEAVRAAAPELPVEVECDTVEQVSEAVAAGARLVLLDNMGLDHLRRAAERARVAGVRTEASGGLELDRAREVAMTGVDYLAVGALTHSAPVLDLGLDIIDVCR